MDQKTYRIAPYETEYWQWLWSALCITFMCWCLLDNWLELPGWAYALIFALSCLGFGLARIRQRGVELFLSAEGIRVRNGGKETVPLTPWSAFECGYILTLLWNGVRGGDHADTYFLLTGKPLDKEALDEIAFHLQTAKPCGIWKEYIAIQTKRSHNHTIRTAIGSRLPLQELRIDMDAFEEETEA